MNTTHHIHIQLTIHKTHPQLCSRIVDAVCALQARKRRTDRAVFGTITIFSFALLVPAIVGMITAFTSSNFGGYMSLVFSDIGSIGVYWKELGLSLIESLPVFSIALTLSLTVVVLWAMRKFYRTTVVRMNMRFA